MREHAINTLANISSNRAAGKDTRPFFKAVGFHKPHLPFVFPERFLSYYPIDEVALPSNPDAPMNMPLIAWQGYGELRQYKDVSNITNKHGQFVHPNSHLLPDDKVKDCAARTLQRCRMPTTTSARCLMRSTTARCLVRTICGTARSCAP